MKTFRFPFLLYLLTFGCIGLLHSCKEKNAEYPPRNWSEYVYTSKSIAYRDISVILHENDHSIWLGSKGSEGLLLNDGYKWNVFNKQNTGIDFDSITCLVRDGNGILWVGWRSGLASYDGSRWQEIAPFKGLRVTSLAVEGIAGIKAGIKDISGGLAVLQNKDWIFYTSANSEIPSAKVVSLQSGYDQTLWIATADKGIISYKTNSWKSLTTGLPLLSQNFSCVTLAPDGSIWAGSEASQLIHFYNDTFTIYNTGTSKPITSVAISGNGTVWCGTLGAGLLKFDGVTWTSFTMTNSALPSDHILDLANFDAGNLLFSIPGGKVLLINQ